MYIKFITVLTISVLTVSITSGQSSEVENQSFTDKVYYGGGIGMSFGTVTSVNVHPLVGYKFTPKLSGGVTLTYQYFRREDDFYSYESNSYGGSVFARYRFIEQLYGHVEYSNINYDFYTTTGEQAYRKWVPFLLVGGGYSNRIGRNSVIFLQVLFDVLQNDHSPYENGQPIYSMGVGVGF